MRLIPALLLLHASAQGCERKFDVKKFVARYPPALTNAKAHGGNPY
jgi:hypothetical protein